MKRLAKKTLEYKLPFYGSKRADVMLVLDPVLNTEKSKYPLRKNQLKWIGPYLKAAGLKKDNVCIVSSCSPVTSKTWKKDKLMGDHLKSERDDLIKIIDDVRPKFIVAMGKSAARQIYGKAIQITKVRGVPWYSDELQAAILPSLGVVHVMLRPENIEIFKADMATMSRIVENDYDLSHTQAIETIYKWCTDLKPLLARPNLRYLSVDIEGVGLRAYDPKTRILTVQLCPRPGLVYVIPIDYNPFDKNGEPYTEANADKWKPNRPVDLKLQTKLLGQLKRLLARKSIRVSGHNYKFDWQMLLRRLDVATANYQDDTLLMAHMCDENMISKSLSDCTRRWTPAMSGYSDTFDRNPIHMQKSRMDLVPPHLMIQYGGGDADASFRLRDTLHKELLKDPRNYNCYRRVVMPAMQTFASIEYTGFEIDVDGLEAFGKKLDAHQQLERNALLAEIPKKIRDEFRETGVGLKLTRDALTRAWLFSHPSGLKLKAVTWTDSTKDEEDEKDRVPSVSTKTHLPYFDHLPIIKKLIAYIKNEKLRTTYVGKEHDEDRGGPTGLWQYIVDGRVRPSYLLHGTVTGRTSSRDPNGQNFPKRGEFAKDYRAIFRAPKGYVYMEVDFSQVELRVAAILSKDPTMLRIYREGGDIHVSTAAAVLGITVEEFNKLDKDTRDLKRYQAKAVNFGFLYGMGWRGFRAYAKTEYGIEFTEDEAKAIRKAFFRLYPNLQKWHAKTQDFVKQHGYVRALDGRLRRLPNVDSTDDAIASMAERQAINSPVQGFANDLGLMAAARIHAAPELSFIKIVGFVHDSLIFLVPEGRVVEAAGLVNRYMESNPLKEWFNFESPIPIPAEASAGVTLANMIEIKQDWLDDDNVVSWSHLKAKIDEKDRSKYNRPTRKKTLVKPGHRTMRSRRLKRAA